MLKELPYFFLMLILQGEKREISERKDHEQKRSQELFELSIPNLYKWLRQRNAFWAKIKSSILSEKHGLKMKLRM